MGKQYQKLDPKLRDFIGRQHIFFTASATKSSRVNISPRSTDCLKILSDNAVIYLDKTGSGNETAAHMLADGRMTIMMCAVDGPPQILRLFGRGRVIHRDSGEFADLLTTWFDNDPPVGTRQIIRLDFDLVQTSCGYAVPLYDFVDQRSRLLTSFEDKGPEGTQSYWAEKNMTSIDGKPTGILN